MKLTEKKLKQMILESMYSPSTLIDDALADPDVHPKIKDLLSSQRDEDKRNGLQLLDTLYGDKYPLGGGDHVHLGTEKYKKQFSKQNERSQIVLMQVKSLARNFSKSINYSPKFPGDTGFTIEKQYAGDDITVQTFRHTGPNTQKNAHGLKELEDLKTYLQKNLGVVTSRIERQGNGAYLFTVSTDGESFEPESKPDNFGQNT